jgi:hypothetical protein
MHPFNLDWKKMKKKNTGIVYFTFSFNVFFCECVPEKDTNFDKKIGLRFSVIPDICIHRLPYYMLEKKIIYIVFPTMNRKRKTSSKFVNFFLFNIAISVYLLF